MFDLDHFGEFNTRHGHQVGDEVLRAFGRLLHDRFRASDLVARYGGEEFIAVLQDAELGDAVRIASEIRERFASLQIPGADGRDVSVTVSAGCAGDRRGERTIDELIRTADVGLLMAKRAGRNLVVTT